MWMRRFLVGFFKIFEFLRNYEYFYIIREFNKIELLQKAQKSIYMQCKYPYRLLTGNEKCTKGVFFSC